MVILGRRYRPRLESSLLGMKKNCVPGQVSMSMRSRFQTNFGLAKTPRATKRIFGVELGLPDGALGFFV